MSARQELVAATQAFEASLRDKRAKAGLLVADMKWLKAELSQEIDRGLDPSTFEYKISGDTLKFRVEYRDSESDRFSGAWGSLKARLTRQGVELVGDWTTGEHRDPDGPKL